MVVRWGFIGCGAVCETKSGPAFRRIEGSHVEISLSYSELVDRARRLLDALSFDQVPVLRAGPGAAEAPIFRTT